MTTPEARMDRLHFKSAVEIARLIRARKIGATETLEHFLDRVAKCNSKLNAIVWLDAERARERAKDASNNN
jgi:amidase